MRYIYIFLATITLSGCAGFGQIERVADLSLEQIKAVNKIQLIHGSEITKYTTKGKVKGISCKGSAFSGNTSEEAAMTQLKIKAVKVGANAIIYPTCSQDASVDWGNNCWESWVCVGEAVVIE